MTLSDKELQARIAYAEKDLRKVRPGSWAAEKVQEQVDYLKRQLARPRGERERFTPGSL